MLTVDAARGERQAGGRQRRADTLARLPTRLCQGARPHIEGREARRRPALHVDGARLDALERHC